MTTGPMAVPATGLKLMNSKISSRKTSPRTRRNVFSARRIWKLPEPRVSRAPLWTRPG